MMGQLTPKATFDTTYPTGDADFSSDNFRANNQALYAGDLLPGRVLAHDVPDTGVMVLGSDASSFSRQLYMGDTSQRMPIAASGDLTGFNFAVTNPKIDVVYLDRSGDYFIAEGAEAATPVHPVLPSGDVLPLVAVYHRAGGAKIVNYADKDSYSGDSYIYQDLRPLYFVPRTYFPKAPGTDGQSLVASSGDADPSWAWTGVVQSVSLHSGNDATGTTAMNADDSHPLITEGDEYMTLAITPKNASNILMVEVVLSVSHTVANMKIVASLFQDALSVNKTAMAQNIGPANGNIIMAFRYFMDAGTTDETTFRVRAGGTTGATLTFNGSAGSRYFGGSNFSSMHITEFAIESSTETQAE